MGRHLKFIFNLPKNYNGSNLTTCRTHFLLPNPCSLLKLSTGSGSSLTTKPLELLVFWEYSEWDFLMSLLKVWQLEWWPENSWCWALRTGSCFLFIILLTGVGSFKVLIQTTPVKTVFTNWKILLTDCWGGLYWWDNVHFCYSCIMLICSQYLLNVLREFSWLNAK